MSDETPRLRLAQLVSLQELNAVTWNEALAQLDALVDLVFLGQYVNTPPSNPTDGDAYLTGGAPTGAWSGYAYKIAACLDGTWRFYIPFNGLRAFLPNSGTFIVYFNGVWTDCNALISANEQALASAASCDLGSANALFVQITGTTSITSFGSGAGKLRFVRFAQALTLTHNATSLILLGGASRVTAAGDVGIYASDASGNWRERSYCRAATNAGDVAVRTGTKTNDNAAAGCVGEYLEASTSTPVTLSNATGVAVLALALSAGDWDVNGQVLFNGASASFTSLSSFTQLTVLDAPSDGLAGGSWCSLNAAFASGSSPVLPAGVRRFSLAAAATVYLMARASFSGSATASGFLRARRVR